MLTRAGMNNILKRIFETGGMSADMESDIQKLRDDFDEREGMLRKFGETYDGEDKEEYDYTPRESTLESEESEYKGKYEEMKQRYIDRFFGGKPDEEEVEETMEEQKEDLERDGTPQTFDELLKKVEG